MQIPWMSEVEKTQMDKRNIASRQLAQPSPRTGNENGGSVGKFLASHQKREFSQNDLAQSKKLPQLREKGGIKKPFSKSPYRANPQGRPNSSSAQGRMSNVAAPPDFSNRWSRPNPRMPQHSKAHYNKEQFLQANCQFVVRQNGDYTIHATNPDTLVEWHLIEQVRIFDNEVPSCPICLFPPKAAKITRCGHSYCWPCMLHYLSVSDETSVNCPICYARVRERDLKSVVALQANRFEIGQEITMKLMKKSRGLTLVSPNSAWSSENTSPFHVSDSVNSCYAKILVADENFVQNILEREREELLILYGENSPTSLEGSFITAAMKSLEFRASNVKSDYLHFEELANAVLLHNLTKDVSDATAAKVTAKISEPVKPRKKYLSAFSDEEEEKTDDVPQDPIVNSTNSTSEDAGDQFVIEEISDAGATGYSAPTSWETCGSEEAKEASLEAAVAYPEKKKFFNKNRLQKVQSEAYFYQSADGQHIYLHAINVTCLKAQYGDMSKCPDELNAKIVHLERIFMDEDLRHRYRWLDHLPLTCEFILAELDLGPPLVSQEILNQHSGEIQKRQRERERKMENDNSRMHRSQNEYCRQMGIDPNARIVRSDFKRRTQPSTVTSMETVFANVTPRTSHASQMESPSTSPVAVVSESPRNEVAEGLLTRSPCSSEDSAIHSMPSFAQMIKMGVQRPASTGIREVPSRPSGYTSDSKGSDSDSEMAHRAPEYRNTFMVDIETKLAELNRGGADGVDLGAGGKKKKKQKKVLFSSGFAFHSSH